MHRKRHPSIAMEIAQDYVHHVLVAVKESVKAVKVVAKMDVKQHAVADADKDVKDVVMQCAKVIASLDVRLPATVYVGDRA